MIRGEQTVPTPLARDHGPDLLYFGRRTKDLLERLRDLELDKNRLTLPPIGG